MAERIIYKQLTSPKLRLINPSLLKAWDNVAVVLSATPAWANTAITLTYDAYLGGIPIVIPAALPAGEYDALVYDSASPSSGDAIQISKTIYWDGTSITRMQDL